MKRRCLFLMICLCMVFMVQSALAMRVFVKIVSSGVQFTIDADADSSILRVKAKIFEEEGIPVSRQSLSFGGDVLQDGQTLADYHIAADDVLQLTVLPGPATLHNNSASTEGPRFRDINPGMTDKWYMFTPIDLSADGSQSIRLIASNARVIGDVTVTVLNGTVTVGCKMRSKQVTVSEEFLTFFPDLKSVTTVNPNEMRDRGFAFDTPISIKDQLAGDTNVLLFVRDIVTYQPHGEGISHFGETSKEYKDRVAQMLALMEK